MTPRIAAGLVLALAGYTASAGLQRPFVPLSEEYGLRAKFEAFEETAGDYTAVYLGSSLVYRSFRPDVIDPFLSQATGQEFRSFNLGMAGMFTQETDALLDRVLAQQPARLRWIVVQVPAWFSPFAHEQLGDNQRAVFAYAPRQTLALLRHQNWRTMPSLHERLTVAANHVRQAVRRHGSIGLGPQLWQAILGARTETLVSQKREFLVARGYASLDAETDTEFIERRQRFADNSGGRAAYRRKLEDWSQAPTNIHTNVRDSYLYELLDSAKRRAAEHDIELVLVGMPTLERNKLTEWLSTDNSGFTLINLSDPRTAPRLFDAELRFDPHHFNHEGAQVFSEAFAARLAETVKNL